MDLIYFWYYYLAKCGISEDIPFDQNMICFRVAGKIFQLPKT